MNPTGKKLISLFLVFSLIEISCTTITLPTKERRFKERDTKRGAEFIIQKKDGQQIKGELIAVKPNSLLLLNTEGKDVSINIEDIKIIKVVEKPKVTRYLLMGAIWGPVGYSIFLLCLYPIFAGGYEGEGLTLSEYYKNALPGILLSPLVMAATLAVFRPKFIRKFKIERMTATQIQETLDYLRKKARVRTFK